MRTMQSIALSPDGKLITYVVNEPAPDEHSKLGSNPAVWIAPVDGGASVHCTENPGADIAPQWSPDASGFAFLSHREGDAGTQI